MQKWAVLKWLLLIYGIPPITQKAHDSSPTPLLNRRIFAIVQILALGKFSQLEDSHTLWSEDSMLLVMFIFFPSPGGYSADLYYWNEEQAWKASLPSGTLHWGQIHQIQLKFWICARRQHSSNSPSEALFNAWSLLQRISGLSPEVLHYCQERKLQDLQYNARLISLFAVCLPLAWGSLFQVLSASLLDFSWLQLSWTGLILFGNLKPFDSNYNYRHQNVSNFLQIEAGKRSLMYYVLNSLLVPHVIHKRWLASNSCK